MTAIFAGLLGFGDDAAGDLGGGPCLLLLFLEARGGDNAERSPPTCSSSAVNSCKGFDNDGVPSVASSNAWGITRELGCGVSASEGIDFIGWVLIDWWRLVDV